jgi:hypothetical protein
MLWSKGNKVFSVKEKFVKVSTCKFVKTIKTSIAACKLKNKSLNVKSYLYVKSTFIANAMAGKLVFVLESICEFQYLD